MGKIIRFRPRRRSKWTRAEAYGGGGSRSPRKDGRGVKPWRQAFSETRPFLLLIGFITLAAILGDGAALEPPGFMQTEAEPVSGTFSRCGKGRSFHCVIDGDTFKLGDRNVRVVGIDTAEVDARCPQEAQLAEHSTAALQSWLNRGPFQMTARIDEPTDRYGRDLRIIKRVMPDGREDRLADYMQAEGGGRSYLGGYRGGWC